MGADILERLRKNAARFHPHATDLIREAAAEIVRLRGEVEQLRVQLAGCGVIAMCNTRESLAQQMPERGAYGWSASLEDCRNAVEREMALRERLEAIAPAEAKGGAHDCMRSYSCPACARCYECNRKTGITPQPADGGAVAFVNTGDSEAQFIADGERLNCPACGGSGHVDDTHPTGDALGAVRELVHKWRTRIPCDTQDTPRILMREWCADELEAALQHRGDSRGGEG